MSSRPRHGRLAGLVAGAVVLAAAVVVLGVLLRRSGLRDAANYAQLLTIPLAVISLVVALRGWFHRTPAPPAPAPEVVPEPLLDLTALDRVGSADALALGVRQAIPHPDGLDEGLPRFVPRPVVATLRQALRAGAEQGGLYVLVGDPAVGKTRALYEAVVAELPDFAVLAPDPGDGAAVAALAARTDELPPLVIWLDQLHRFLDGPYLRHGDIAVDPRAVRRLLAADTPVVVVGTAWPEHVRALCTSDDDGARHPATVELLDDPRCTTLPVEPFTDDERAAAEELCHTDPRLAEALAHPRYSVTAALAGVPEQVRQYAEATDGLRALVHAAVDARRLGVLSPLTPACLREAGRAHLRAVRADDEWFAEALAVPDVLVPVTDRRGVVGYVLADHLAQHVLRDRRREPVPELVWTVLADETADEADLARLAEAATRRHIHRVAVPLWCRLVAAGHPGAAAQLVTVFTQWGDTRALKKVGPPFDRQAAQALSRLAARRTPDERPAPSPVHTPPTTTIADPALWRLTDLLHANGHHKELAIRAAMGDCHAAVLLAQSAGAVDDAVALLGPGLVAGDRESVRALASIRYEQEDFVAAARLVTPYATEGWAGHLLRAVKVAARDVDWLTAAAASGDVRAGRALVRMRYQDRDIQALARHVLDDDEFASLLLARTWYERGDLPALRTRAAAGNRYAAWLLGTALVERDDVDGLVELVVARTPVVPGMLARLLLDRADRPTLERLTDPACTLALALLHAGRCDDPDELLSAVPRVFDQVPALFDERTMATLTRELRRRLAAAEPDADEELLLARANVEEGQDFQHAALASMLTESNDVEALTWLVSIGRGWAAPPLATLHLHRGDVDAAITALTSAAEDGNDQAAATLAETLYQYDRDTALRARADAGDPHAAARVAMLLHVTEDTDELVERARSGDAFAVDYALEHLQSPEDRHTAIGLLEPWAAAGSAAAAHRLSALHERDGDLDEAAAVLQPLADTGDPAATRRITELTYTRGDLPTLRRLADHGDRHAARRIATALRQNNDTAGLAREVAANNTDDAARHLLELHRSTTKDKITSLSPAGTPDHPDWRPLP